MNDNMEIWDKLKSVPEEFTKKITGGRLKGMTDIKPQWRIMALTEKFGPCGIGWHYAITDRWTECAGDEISAHIQIDLFIKVDGEWSMPITGVGGSMLLAQEKNGAHHSDEAYKMALTDAISVAAKSIGVAAEIYMGHPAKNYEPVKTPALTEDQKTLLNKALRFYTDRGDSVKTGFISEMLTGSKVEYYQRVADAYAVDSAKKVFTEEQKPEESEQKELY